MTPSLVETKSRKTLGIWATSLVLTVGMVTVLSAGPACSSGREDDEAYEQRGAGKSESKFYGTVQKIPAEQTGTWVVNGREIMVAKDTRIKEEYGKAVEGAYVEVEGNNTGKTFTAYKIEVKRARK